MRLGFLVLAALLAAGCAGRATSVTTQAARPAVAADLEISVWRQGTDGPVFVRGLRCPGGDSACARLTTLDDPFAPVPADSACTQIYGGPEVAEVVGRFEGRRIRVRFTRTDGCEIARWDKHAFLFSRM